ncbi:triphosphoribosyl-dephospho-CoA synthase [Lactiplantibacillus sp. DA1]|uniref:triphosphoribosyl-dephospho-CoA synthase n=1 Tax=Lactiplantibacillus sp. DA1 TaxID=3079857 RepID=UPI00292A6486|nr:triphosphoribosyl-dephospho-CoA synthase [Lactiplantibacillus sp. DA1]MDV0429358.1 triphosphoribosyl-dephospho-CoA synthase [Lactiplantibacillus sp. DA1]
MGTAAIVKHALQALLYEVTVNPKPGLVDPLSPGPHPDMNAFMFIDSALSLEPYFKTCASVGATYTAADLTGLFQQLREAGLQAEKTMFATTNGVNTHKGAVFSLGILVAATAYQKQHAMQPLTTIVQTMLVGLTANDFSDLASKDPAILTAGEREYLTYGIKGIRGEAEAGYPTVMSVALPALRRSQGTINQRLLDTLMAIVQATVDTNLVKRAKNKHVVDWVHAQAQQYFKLGGSQTEAGMLFLRELNQIFVTHNYSLGGSADLLILTIFMGLEMQLLN